MKTILKQDDIVTLTAISITDGWHNQRNRLLHRDYRIIKVDNSFPTATYKYENWYKVRMEPIKPFAIQHQELDQLNSIFFERCQLKKTKITKKERDLFSAKLTIREKILDRINTELNNESILKKKSIAAGIIPTNEFDVEKWKQIFKEGYKVEASFAREREAWHDAGKGSFEWSHNKVKFRLKDIS